MARQAIVAAALLCATAGAAAAQTLASAPAPAHYAPQPAGAPWPTLEWAEAPLPADARQSELNQALDEAFAGFHPDLGDTRAVLAVQDGRIVLERYERGYGASTRLISWSMAKSVTSALVGAAVLQGRVNIDQPLGSPHWRAGDARAAITWRQFLNMVDGQSWNEMRARSVVGNDSARMLYGSGAQDTAAFAANQPLINPPGTHWNYNSGGIVLVADALTRSIVPDAKSPEDRRARMRAWMDQALFARLGMHPVVEFDPQGLFYGSALMHMTARDYARFGLLYLRGGVWDGVRVVPEGWVDFARGYGPDGDIYGAGWWLTPQHGTGAPLRALITDNAMADAFSAQGHEGQIILVVPSKDLVVVRLGRFDDTPERWDRLGDWMQRVAQCFANRPAAPPA
jgi:CubicO group peptidase (beta-lactamase class C family)